MAWTYIDPMTGRTRLKRRYLWGICGLIVGMIFGLILGAAF